MPRFHHFMCALLTLSWTAPLAAQQPTGTIRGRITDNSTQQPIAGVTIIVGNRSAQTHDDGRFTISGVPAGSDLLRARMIGYAQINQPVMVGSGDTVAVDLALTAQAIGLSEVVVTGYGQQRAGNITGAVTAVADSQFNTGRVISPQLLIQSKVAGVQVVDNNDPGGGLSIRIRGATSVNASSEPLYVVDGVPLGNGAGGGLSAGRDPLNYLNPNDIESITVLRDASAAAIYGSNAANGVVLITTKSGGTHQKPQFEYNSSASASSVTRLPAMMNAAQFATALNTYAPARDTLLLGASTDWFGLIDRTAYGQEHNFAVTNSTSDMSYRLSLGYLNQAGIIRASSTKRVSLGLNYSQQLFNDRLNVHTSVRGSRAVDQFTPGDVLGNAAAMAPTQPVLDSSSATGYWDWKTSNAAPSNPVASLTWARDHGTTWRSVGNVQAVYRAPFIEGLTANVNLGYDLARADRTTFYPNNLAAQVRQGQGLLFLANNSQTNEVLESFLGYSPSRSYGPGRLDVVGGYSYTQSHAEYPSLRETGLTTNVLGDNGIPVAGNVQNRRDIVDYKLISFFGRLNYNINDRYLAAFSVRRDGSSRFGPGNQWGTFPSVAFAWRLSQESFLQGVSGLSDLKLRASWAKTGNQAFQDYLQYPTYTFSDGQTQVQFGNVYTTTIRPSAVDPNIHWEKTTAYNVGVDFGFSNQRFNGTIDWYTKNTNDLIFYIPIPAGTNLGNYVTTNIGSMRNRGIEFSLNADVLRHTGAGLSWTASLTAARNTNELLAINPNKSVSKILTGGISGGVGNNVEVLEPGIPVNSFFVYQQRYDASGKPIYDPATPTNMYVDQNGDGIINDSDRRPFHDPSPKWILGHSSYFNYKRFDASLTLRAYLGNWVYNNVASANGAYQNLTGSGMPSNLHTSVLKTGFVVPQYYSDYFVEDAAFLRMDNITVGYAASYRGQQFRLFGTIQNAFTITGYSGVDPTSGLNGIDNNIYPRARTITTGLNIRF
ncbi:MAG: SusC/RagA family TonB-linked outer membrane protein [Gemmatimonadetes bacterium]|nr:MAG: SusC/RagA family TonB-linked outer membrane protein [Gemmatimonadota bacterium]